MKKTGKPLDLVGRTFGRLLVIRREGTLRKRVVWRCRCVCNKEILVRSDRLASGQINTCKKCGVIRVNHLAKDEHRCWDAMLQRCTNSKTPGYKHYGGRGIKVCKRWMVFENFLSDMGPRPTLEYSIDRWPNPNGDYEPNNCRWATDKEQMRNTTVNVWVEFNGQRRLLIELAEENGITGRLAAKRLLHGWSLERAVTQPSSRLETPHWILKKERTS